MIILQHPVHRNSQIPWAHTRRRDKANLWERLEAPLPPSRPRCNFIYPRQPGAFPQHLELLPFQVMKSFQATKMVPSGTSIYRVKMDPDKVLYIIWLMIKKLPQTSRHQKGSLIHLLGQTVSVNIAVIVYQCRSGSESTTGTLGADAEKKMPSQSRLQAGGMSLPCRKHLSMSIMTFLQAGSTWPITEDARFSTTRVPSTPILTWSPRTFITPVETCQIVKEVTNDGATNWSKFP